ncbi:uncharacterized protein PGTG_02470 [Puccinia graminis f. sp. tritici CRL 75-36-700-3]|uniref:Uncharacterized protein n=1 Tax=Puccinia graminis f. sp. tritici (strain CRL 75-36-700-3 / race SCCL) TaxID=418459 RepID=E3JY84_PUCGT|nr:uncharacterized protein PGTG_02470 [Puccinia graminis f. sp. tritici CRL 75-36-700-3]EFP77009.2 hypothetical protein PGTG_02470 [Puccinia graminis f. sp. tritici CRL 75-36-700-3]
MPEVNAPVIEVCQRAGDPFMRPLLILSSEPLVHWIVTSPPSCLTGVVTPGTLKLPEVIASVIEMCQRAGDPFMSSHLILVHWGSHSRYVKVAGGDYLTNRVKIRSTGVVTPGILRMPEVIIGGLENFWELVFGGSVINSSSSSMPLPLADYVSSTSWPTSSQLTSDSTSSHDGFPLGSSSELVSISGNVQFPEVV